MIIRLPTKDEIKILIKQKKFLVTICILTVLLSVLGIAVFTGAINTPLTDPLTSFKAPSYIPDGYVNVENNTTANIDKSFTFADKKNNNYFMVAAVKDMEKSEFAELTSDSPMSEQMEGMGKTSAENMTVDGHPVTFKMINMDFMGMQIHMFHASWTCPQNGLNMITMGKIEANQTEAMKKMITSIQCHQENMKWKIPGL